MVLTVLNCPIVQQPLLVPTAVIVNLSYSLAESPGYNLWYGLPWLSVMADFKVIRCE
ncbi:MAG: hypothetical protein WDZ91_12035 [Paenibacillaceae bacterium]